MDKKLIILDSLLIQEIKYDYIVLRKDLTNNSYLIVSEAKWEEEAVDQIKQDIKKFLINEFHRLYNIYLWNKNKYIPYELMKNQ